MSLASRAVNRLNELYRSVFGRMRAHEARLADPLAGVDPFLGIEPLEQRLLLTAAPTLPGMQLVDPSAHNFDGQVIYLDFDGAVDITYHGPQGESIEGIGIPAYKAPDYLDTDGAAIVNNVVTTLGEVFFHGTGMTFTSTRPASGGYSTIYIGGTDDAFASLGEFYGLAENLDIGNQDPGGNAFVFADEIPPGAASATQYSVGLAQLIAHEVGRLVGFADIDEEVIVGQEITLDEVDLGKDHVRVDGVTSTSNSGTFYVKTSAYVWFEAKFTHWWGGASGGINMSFPNFDGSYSSRSWTGDRPSEVYYPGDPIWPKGGSSSIPARDLMVEGYESLWENWLGYESHTLMTRLRMRSSGETFQFRTRAWVGTTYVPSTGPHDQQNYDVYEYTICVDGQGPYAPGSLQIRDSDDSGYDDDDEITSDRTPRFTWSRPSDRGCAGVKGYYYSVSDSTPDTNDSYTTSTYADMSLSEGSATFYVCAVDNAGNLGSVSSVGYCIDQSGPYAPSLSSPANNTSTGDTTPPFDWSNGSDRGCAGVYRWEFDVDRDIGLGIYWDYLHKTNLSSSSYTPSSSEAFAIGSKYRWRARAIDKAGNPGDWSSWRYLTVVPPPPPPPTGVKIESTSAQDTGRSQTDGITKDDKPKFVWNPPSVPTGIAFYEYQIDSGSIKSTGSSNAYWEPGLFDPPIPEGLRSIKFRAVENSAMQKRGEWSSAYGFRIDKTPPSPPSLVSPGNNSEVTDTTPRLDWSDVSDLWKYHVYVSDHGIWPLTDVREADRTVSYWDVSPALGYKDWWWKVMATDVAGNEGAYTGERKFTVTVPTPPPPTNVKIESTASQDTGKSQTDGITKDDKPKFVWTAPSVPSGIAFYEYQIDNGPVQSTGSSTANWEPGLFDPPIPEGSRSIRFRAVENSPVKKRGQWSSSYGFRIDKTAPAPPSLVSPPAGVPTLDTTPTLDWSDVSDLWKYHVYVSDHGIWPLTDVREADRTVSYWDVSPALGYKDWWWKVMATDVAGNEGNYSNEWLLPVRDELDPPSPPSNLRMDPASDLGKHDDDRLTNDSTPTFTWGASSDASGIQKYQYKLVGPTSRDWSDIGGPDDRSITLATFWGLAGIEDGEYILYVRAVDDSMNHNVGSASEVTFTIDTEAPNPPTLSEPADESVTPNTTPILEWNSRADLWKYQAHMSDHGWLGMFPETRDSLEMEATSWTVWPALPYRDWWWQVKAWDLAGNPSTYSAEWKLLVKPELPTAPPNLKMDPASDLGKHDDDRLTSDDTPTFLWDASSSLAGIHGYQFKLEGPTTMDWSTIGGPADRSITLATWWGLAGIEDGDYTLRVRAVDDSDYHQAGFESSITFTIDTEAPPKPGELTPHGNAGSQNPLLAWSEVTDESGIDYYHPRVWWYNALGGEELLWESDVSGASEVLLPVEFVWDRDYTWCVTAVDEAGNASPNGPFDNNFTPLYLHSKLVFATPEAGTFPLAGVDIYRDDTKLGTTAWNIFDSLVPSARITGLETGDEIRAEAPHVGTGTAIVGDADVMNVTIDRTTGPAFTCWAGTSDIVAPGETLPVGTAAFDISGVDDDTVHLRYWLNDLPATEVDMARLPFSPWDVASMLLDFSSEVMTFGATIPVPEVTDGSRLHYQVIGENSVGIEGQSDVHSYLISGAASLFDNRTTLKAFSEDSPYDIDWGMTLNGKTTLVVENDSTEPADLYLTVLGPRDFTIDPYDVVIQDAYGNYVTEVESFTVQKGGDWWDATCSIASGAFTSAATSAAGAAIATAIVNAVPVGGQLAYGAAVAGAAVTGFVASTAHDILTPMLWPTEADNYEIGVASIALPNVPAGEFRSINLRAPSIVPGVGVSDFIVLHNAGGGLTRPAPFTYRYAGGDPAMILPEQDLPPDTQAPALYTIQYDPIVNEGSPLFIEVHGPSLAGSSQPGFDLTVRDVTGGRDLTENAYSEMTPGKNGELMRVWWPALLGERVVDAEAKEGLRSAYKAAYAEMCNQINENAGVGDIWHVDPDEVDVSYAGEFLIVSSVSFFQEWQETDEPTRAAVKAVIDGAVDVAAQAAADKLTDSDWFSHAVSTTTKGLAANMLGGVIGVGLEIGLQRLQQWYWDAQVGEAVDTSHVYCFWPEGTGPATYQVRLNYKTGSPMDSYQEDPRLYQIRLSQGLFELATSDAPRFDESYGGCIVLEAEAGSSVKHVVSVSGDPTPELVLSGEVPDGLTFDPATRTLTWSPPTGTPAGVNTCILLARNGIGVEAQVHIETRVLAGPLPPEAWIEAITPNPAQPPVDVIQFDGGSRDEDGQVTAWEWRSDLDDVLSTTEDWTTSSNTLTVGSHEISFRVWDDEGLPSAPPAVRELIVSNALPTAEISGTPGSPVSGGSTIELLLGGHDNDENGQSIVGGQLLLDGSLVASPMPGAYQLTAPASPGQHTLQYRVEDDEGSWSDPVVAVLHVQADIVGRHVFYNNSLMDGNTPGASAADDNAIDDDKHALTPGNTGGVANCTAYSKGLNGIMVDIDGLSDPGGLNLATIGSYFGFEVGNSDDPGNWSSAPAPVEVDVRLGEGDDGSDRVTLIWADNAIQKQWLKVTVKAGDATGLDQDGVFCFGNMPGDATGDGVTNSQDLLKVRQNYRGPASAYPAADFNTDGVINSIDLLAVRQNYRQGINMISMPAPLAAPAGMAPAGIAADGSGSPTSSALLMNAAPTIERVEVQALPVAGATGVTIRAAFRKSVSVRASALELARETGLKQTEAVSAFRYEPVTRTASWTMVAVEDGFCQGTLSADEVTANDLPMPGDYLFRFRVLDGRISEFREDRNGDGVVDLLDLIAV